MTVYVDDMRAQATVGRTTARWSHMTADSTAELNAFAARLGLRRDWIQYPGTWKEHYDLTDSVRTKALRLGAVALTVRESTDRLITRRRGDPWQYIPPEPDPTQPHQEALWTTTTT